MCVLCYPGEITHYLGQLVPIDYVLPRRKRRVQVIDDTNINIKLETKVKLVKDVVLQSVPHIGPRLG